MDPKLQLLLAIFLPLVGAGSMWVLAPLGDRWIRIAALVTTLITLLLVVGLVVQYPLDGATSESVFAETNADWISPVVGGLDIRFHIGLDGLGLWMFALSALLMLTSVLVSWESIRDEVALFYGMLLLLECGCLGVFAARDIILFYIFFEFTLIPLFFLIGKWGSENRRYAAQKFFIFTLAGSLLTFLGLLALVVSAYLIHPANQFTFSIPALTEIFADPAYRPSLTVQVVIFWALFAGFAIKVPLFPLHTWLPLAHVQAPTAGSVFLAGILLKIGTYGFLRFNIPMLPDATAICMPWLLWLAVAGILYGALVALAQRDIKRLIAYSSVSHLGFCMLGLFALNPLGVRGGVLQMVNHGISTGALFAIVGMLYERYHTREISKLGGLAKRTPWLAFFMVVFTFSSIGVPGTNGFAGEFLVLIGMFQRAWGDSATFMDYQLRWISVLAVLGVVLGAWYMLWLVQRVFFGPLKEPPRSEGEEVKDMSLREIAALAPLAVLVVWIGLQPGFFTRAMDADLDPIIGQARQQADQQFSSEVRAAEPRVAQGGPEATTKHELPLVHRQNLAREQSSRE